MDHSELLHRHGNMRKTAHLKERLQNEPAFDSVAALLSLMADASRVRIFWLLCHCEECVLDISAMVEMSSPAVSHHLRALREAGLITSRRDGKEVFYCASSSVEAQLIHRMIEQVMEISCPRGEEGEAVGQAVEGYSAEQVETVRRIHDMLVENPGQRVTIEELSHQFLMNPTTLKEVFKAVYGDSLASHIRQHRMEHAAELLRDTDMSIGAVAAAVGYDSASRFSAAFKEHYYMLPTEFRKL